MIFIPGNVPSSKNSKIKTTKGIFNSKTVVKYLKSLGIKSYSSSRKEVVGYTRSPNIFKQIFIENNWVKPSAQTIVGFHFVRGTRHKIDFGNINQIILDLMTAHDFIEDDNMNWVIPFPMRINKTWVSYDKDKPGVFIECFTYEEYKKNICF